MLITSIDYNAHGIGSKWWWRRNAAVWTWREVFAYYRNRVRGFGWSAGRALEILCDRIEP